MYELREFNLRRALSGSDVYAESEDGTRYFVTNFVVTVENPIVRKMTNRDIGAQALLWLDGNQPKIGNIIDTQIVLDSTGEVFKLYMSH